MLINTGEYLETIEQIKSEIQAAQYKAAVSVSQEIILLYHSIGEVISSHKVWGNKFIDSLAKDIKLAFPNAKGYSVRNLKYMAKFAISYPDRQFVQTVSAQIPWSHNIAILDKVKLFYNLNLRCYVVIELKMGDFKPEYAGQLNFYLSAVDGILKKEQDNPSIGLLLCKSKNDLVAEYSLKDMSKPIGVSEYRIIIDLPTEFEKQLPSIEDIQRHSQK